MSCLEGKTGHMETLIGLFDKQEDAGRAIEELSRIKLGKKLTLITADQVTRKPLSVDVDRFGIEENSVVGSNSGGWDNRSRGEWHFLSPEKNLDDLGKDEIHGLLKSSGCGEREAQFYAEGVKHGGILFVVEAKQDQRDTVQEIFQNSNAVKMGET